MQDYNRNYRDDNDKSTLAVLAEIAKLLVLLCWKGLKALGRLLLKFLKFLLRWLVKGLLAIIDGIDYLSNRLKAFWNNNDTQEKIHKIGRGLKNACFATISGIGIGLLYVGKGIVWLLKKLFVGLIHLNTTLKILGRWIVKITVMFGKWVGRQGTNFKVWCGKKKQQYKAFRRNKGFKGLLVDMRDGLKGGISNFIEDDQQKDTEQSESDSVEEPEELQMADIFDDDDDDIENYHGLKKVGKKIYRAMQRLVEV